MATIREGSKAVLLVVDAQVGVMSETWHGQQIIERIGRVVESARALGVPSIWIQHADEERMKGCPVWQFVSSGWRGLSPTYLAPA